MLKRLLLCSSDIILFIPSIYLIYLSPCCLSKNILSGRFPDFSSEVEISRCSDLTIPTSSYRL